jgi:hypothetical protein
MADEIYGKKSSYCSSGQLLQSTICEVSVRTGCGCAGNPSRVLKSVAGENERSL